MTSKTVNTKLEHLMPRFKKYLSYANLEYNQYQYEGVRWILNNEIRYDPVCSVRGGFIADEMGLGKTIMMIGTMLCNLVSKTLIVLPPVLIDQWFTQIYKTTKEKALIYHGDNKKKITLEELKKHKIVITTYGAITINKRHIRTCCGTLLHKVAWSRIIFDEAHHLRNSNTSLYIGAKALTGRIKWLVSGTPIQNSKKDFYSLCELIGITESFYSTSENLRIISDAFILKRSKKKVGIKMPDLLVKKNIIKWNNTKEIELAKELHDALPFNSAIKSNNSTGHLLLMLCARQLCIYPPLMYNKINNMIDSGFITQDKSSYNELLNNYSSKLDFAVNIILKNKNNGCGKIIFCHFRKEIDQIATRLNAGGITKIAIFDGRTTTNKRYNILNAKNEVLILQIQTGCEGLNLQENYSEIYFISPHWNPALEDQAIARCHRIGQTKTVYVMRFIMDSFYPYEETFNNDSNLITTSIDNYIETTQEFKRDEAKIYLE